MHRDVSVREVMNGDYVGVSESDDLVESVELLLSEGVDVGLVLRGEEAVGALTPTDALSAFVDAAGPAVEASARPDVRTAMSEEVPSIGPDRGLHEARDRMTASGTSWLAVTEGQRPLGVLTEHDLLAGSTIGTEPVPDEDRDVEAAVIAPSAAAAGTEDESANEDAFEDQGICEACGALTADLVALNGQLRCADCRDV